MPQYAGGNSCLFANLPRRNRTVQLTTHNRNRQSKLLSAETTDACEKKLLTDGTKKVDDMFAKTPMMSATRQQHADGNDVAHAWNDDACDDVNEDYDGDGCDEPNDVEEKILQTKFCLVFG